MDGSAAAVVGDCARGVEVERTTGGATLLVETTAGVDEDGEGNDDDVDDRDVDTEGDEDDDTEELDSDLVDELARGVVIVEVLVDGSVVVLVFVLVETLTLVRVFVNEELTLL